MTQIRKVLTILQENPTIVCNDDMTEEMENLSDPTKPYLIKGNLLALLERLDDEFTKVLQNADCHSTDYVEK